MKITRKDVDGPNGMLIDDQKNRISLRMEDLPDQRGKNDTGFRFQREFERAKSKLTVAEIVTLDLFYGLDDKIPMTSEELGARFGVTGKEMEDFVGATIAKIRQIIINDKDFKM
jgi:DNA-directed RNA polymerase sigma subunit (sigma70/sigma32)